MKLLIVLMAGVLFLLGSVAVEDHSAESMGVATAAPGLVEIHSVSHAPVGLGFNK